MAKDDPKKLEKALAKQARREARKNKEQAKKNMIQDVYSGEISLANAQKWDLQECWVSDNWRDPKHLCQLVVVRRSTGGQIAMGLFLVDLGCLGVKNANSGGFASYGEFREEIFDNLQRGQEFVACSLDFVAKVVKTAIAYAKSLGFEPHKDAKKAMRMLGDAQPENCPDEIPTGIDGKPFYANGPYENPMRVINTLNRTVGEGNYQVMLIEGAEMFGSEEFDRFDDFDGTEDMDDDEFVEFLETKEGQKIIKNFEKLFQEYPEDKVIDVQGRNQ